MTALNYEQLISLPEDFDYGSIVKINIKRCKLKSLIELKLERFYNLQELDCSFNKLSSLDGLSNCTSLQKLDCGDNKITNLSGLSNCTSLQKLDCRYNKLKNLDGLSNCTSLQDLDCICNKLSSLDGLSNCISLQELGCGYNKITNLNGLSNFIHLQIFWCQENEITNLDVLRNCTSLQDLDCSYNQITNLDVLRNCTSLRKLDCNDNKLSNLNGLDNCSSLQDLDCVCNKITNLDALSGCTSLQKLNCNGNKLINLDGLSNCTSLQVLTCIYNKITNLNGLSKCIYLQWLFCSYNKITNLDGLSNCTSLYELECDHNQLKTLLPIRYLRNLRKIIYYDYNPFEGPHHPAVLRILNRDKNISNIYNDTQNVHNSEINISVNTSINNLLKAHSISIKCEEEIIDKLIDLKFSRIEDLKTYFNNKDVHSYFNMTFFEVFQLVFAEIESLNFNPEILKRLEEELIDSNDKCFTGRLTRTVNCLNSFSEHVNIRISDISQINTVMSLIKNDFENGKIKKEELLDTVRKRLEEYDVKEEIIEFYLEIFSEMYLE